VVESAGRSDERQPRLLLVGEDVHVDARAGRDRACQLLLVYGIPDRRSGDEADRLATELPRDTHLGPDDFDDLRDLALRYRVLARQALPIRVNARWRSSSRTRPPSGSATSRRVVFEPMSMHAQTTGLRVSVA